MKRLISLAIATAVLAIPAGAQAKVIRGMAKAPIVHAVVRSDGLEALQDYQVKDCWVVKTYRNWAVVNITANDRLTRLNGECDFDFAKLAPSGHSMHWQPDTAILRQVDGQWKVVIKFDELSVQQAVKVPKAVLKALINFRMPKIRIPTGYIINPQYKPRLITTTADGSGYFGGKTGRSVEPPSRSLRNLGHVRWTDYGTFHADAVATVWVKAGPGSTAEESFHAVGTVKLHFYDPVGFTFLKLTVREGHRVQHFSSNGLTWLSA